jgi:hypothetical protein
MLFADLPIDVTRIIAALLVNNRPLLDVVRVRFDRPVCGSNVRSTRGHDGEPRGPCSCIHILIRPTHVHHNPPLSRRYQQREGEVHTRSPPPKWAQVSGVRRRSTHDFEHHCSATVPYNVIPSQLRRIHCPQRCSHHRDRGQNNIPTQEEHLVGLDEELKTNPVRRSAPAMRCT